MNKHDRKQGTISWSVKNGEWSATLTTTASFQLFIKGDPDPEKAASVERLLRDAEQVIDSYTESAMKQLAEAVEAGSKKSQVTP